MTPAERHARYRASGKTITATLRPPAAEALATVMAALNCSQREAIEEALKTLAARLAKARSTDDMKEQQA